MKHGGNYIFIFDTGGREEGLPRKESLSGIKKNVHQYVLFLEPQGKPKSLYEEASIVAQDNLNNSRGNGGGW